ncbi:MAG: WecB/TagA/CpsF family glycosyltransferase [Proteobacteria bacterium]|nr:WecB/TagA/CpsF family glycosyltransferase [Pseudomonadota bacterium]
MSDASFPAPLVAHDRLTVLGTSVSAIDLDRAIAVIEDWVTNRTPNYVCVTGAHGIIESRRDQLLRRIHNDAGIVAPDGMPVVFLARRLGIKTIARVYGPDLMRRLTEISARRGYRQFYYGGSPGLAERLAATLKVRHPGLVVAGTFTPPYRPLTPEEDEAAIAAINASQADVLWVGLSTPKQEFWMASHVGRLNVPVLIGVGAAFDFLAGTKPQAPAWMQQAGLEWAYRLGQEPRRLWRRYARIVPLFLMLATMQLVLHRISRLAPAPRN